MNWEKVFDAPPVSAENILQNRSERVERQREMLSGHAGCVVSFTLNIPGAVKQFPLARAAFDVGLAELRQTFEKQLLKERILDLPTGSEALLALSMEASAVKEQTVAIEDVHPLGRLFDMDVLDADGHSVSRQELGTPARRCLLCGNDAKICGRSRAHSLDALRLQIARMLVDYFRDRAADACATCAVRALLYEVSVTPKPGLVDRANSGSHQDMDFFTFLDSSAALSPWFREMFCIGWDHADQSAEQLFQRLRFAGRGAEQAMLDATGGVNTHKGLIFSLGMICGAMGAKQARADGAITIDTILALCKEMGACALEDFVKPSEEPYGVRCYHEHCVFGARGEAARGFPAVMKTGLPALLRLTERGLCLNDACAITLLALIAEVTDTNMIHRGGMEIAEEYRQKAKMLLETSCEGDLLDAIRELDNDFIAQNLSPGGCADLLAVSLMLYFAVQSGYVLE